MPKRTDLESILILGSGPIVIEQAAEFDYSGTQAVRALRENHRSILVERISIEPALVTPSWISFVSQRERCDRRFP
jgi:carbamoyl-phosphate synthase large subunit